MDLYGQLFHKVLFPTWETILRRRPTLSLLHYVEQTQWCSLDELLAIQTGELRRLFQHAYAYVPFYRERFRSAGLHPNDIRSVEDLNRVPLLTRPEAQESAQTRRSTAPPWPTIHKATSGTSGRPLTFAYDVGSEYWRQALKLRGYGWAGYHIGTRALYYWGMHSAPKPPSLLQRAKVSVDRWAKQEHYVNCGRRSEEDLNRVVAILRQEQPVILICFAFAAADLARYVVQKGLRAWPDIPVLCGAEKLFAADRALVEQAFGPHVFETYGSREVMLMGAECEAHQGMHLSMENLVVEVLVREGDTTRAALPGETGEVAVTDLHNYGMPFIRYLNGDLATAGAQTRCACGRNLLRISDIQGRVTDTLRDAQGGRVAGVMLGVFLAPVGQAVQQFQAIQHPNGALTFKFVPGPGFTEATRSYLQSSIEQYLRGFPVTLERVDDIPVGAHGKRKVVIVEEPAS